MLLVRLWTDQQATVSSEFSGPMLAAHWIGCRWLESHPTTRTEQVSTTANDFESSYWEHICVRMHISLPVCACHTIKIVVKTITPAAHAGAHAYVFVCICVYSTTTMGRGRSQKPVFCLCLYSTFSTICRNVLLLFKCIGCSISMAVYGCDTQYSGLLSDICPSSYINMYVF